MDNQDDYRKALGEALAQRQEWLEKKELPKLKEEFRVFHSSFSRVYSLLLKKGVINEDPYKNEAKMGEIQVPDTDEFSDSERVEKLSIRLSNYDNQLDFLVNFYQFSLEFLTIDRIKRILGLVKYIDWTHFAVNSTSLNTRALADMVNTLRAGVDPLSATIIGESLQMLSKSTGVILKYLKEITEYDKQLYKYDVRTKISGAMDLNESNALGQIRRNFSQAMPGRAFYPELIEELIKEDYSGDGAALREKVLQELKVADSKPKPEKNTVPLKPTLIEGLNVLGSLSSTINEIISKIDENSGLLENTKNGFWDKFRRLMHQMMNKEPDPLVYELEYMDQVKGIPVREKVNYPELRLELERKARNCATLSPRGAASAKLEAADEAQLLSLLGKNISELQSLHKTLTALDEFFKSEAPRENREKVRGIKPELAAMKNNIITANRKRHEYTARKEEEEQLKRLGIQQ